MVAPRNELLDAVIVEAAIAEVGAKGWGGATIEGIAARAGVGRGSIYRRWSSKTKLFQYAATVFTLPHDEVNTGSLTDDLVAAPHRRCPDSACRVVFWYPSGNRDESVFTDPFRFDIHRSPNPHIAFGGGGVHYCLGANLAHKEIQVVIRSIATGWDIELDGPAVWAGAGPVHNVGISIDSLPVRITARS